MSFRGRTERHKARRKFAVIGVLIAVVGLIGGFFALRPDSAPIADVNVAPSNDNCVRTVAIFARGSNEGAVRAADVINSDDLYGRWKEVQTELRAELDKNPKVGSKVKIEALEYTATDAIGLLDEAFAQREKQHPLYEALSGIQNSANKGTLELIRSVKKHRKEAADQQCPSPRFLLSGYSQGAMAVTPVAMSLHRTGLLAGTMMVGYPYQDGGLQTLGTGDRGRGLYTAAGMHPGTPTELLGANTLSLCRKNDMFCDFSGTALVDSVLGGGPNPHTEYFKDTDEGRKERAETVQQLVSWIIDSAENPVPEEPTWPTMVMPESVNQGGTITIECDLLGTAGPVQVTSDSGDIIAPTCNNGQTDAVFRDRGFYSVTVTPDSGALRSVGTIMVTDSRSMSLRIQRHLQQVEGTPAPVPGN
ncbi:cutinase family protein [Corynebacterium ulceribovis]|uniref:cutinase family protein n=1 Tax=Corynebacterium ulceribovis TaxID=487732 RepID=UPI00058B9916|nr:cutinase family protein [Corynebacterium ulceribovis]